MSTPTTGSRSSVIRADILNDDAMQQNQADRVHYATGILLAAEDFRAEQQYHRGRQARALRYLHGPGTVAGLHVTYEPEVAATEDTPGREEQLWVDAGLAIDQLGRLIELRTARCIRLERWYDYMSETAPDTLATARHTVTLQADRSNPDGTPALPEAVDLTGVVLDIFLRFFVCEQGKTPAFASGPFDALDAVLPARLRDSAEVLLVPRTVDAPRYPVDPYAAIDEGLDAIADADERERTRRLRLRTVIFDAWDEPDDPRARARPVEIPEQIDSTSVFLARLVLPAGLPPASHTAPPRSAGEPVEIDNSNRLFAYTPRALAAWLGL
jgi:hypothetical protein